MNTNWLVFHERRQKLLDAIKQAYPQVSYGVVLIIGSFEHDRYRFRQESSCYYLTGIKEAGIAYTIDFTGKTTLYVPNCGINRAAWVESAITPETKEFKNWRIDDIRYVGDTCKGYRFSPLFTAPEYKNIINYLTAHIRAQGKIFTLNSDNPHEYIEQKLVLERLGHLIPGLASALEDISPLVARMRRKKSEAEVESIYRAVEITLVAQEAAARVIEDGKIEYEIQAGIEFMFTESGARPAFPSIVASGQNSTVLHYNSNKNTMKAGDLVVIDIGAELDYYCADITRTYPVSGKFSQRQRQLYNLVLETQRFIEQQARPGYWLNNKEHPQKSLQHLAQKFLDDKGYGKYFIHGIGHFLGLDVHDVGNTAEPLQEGDVITIEPGIYIPQEGIGIRIEDDYWISKDGTLCLSQELPKEADIIEEMAQASITDEEDEFEYEEEDDDSDVN